jgi:excisionase family DNA binding protein
MEAIGGSLMSSVTQIETVDPADEVMTAPMAAALKGVHRNSVHKAIKEGRLKASRSGKSWLIRRRDLDAWQVVGHRPIGTANGSESSPFEAPLTEQERAERAIQLLDEWMADESGHDEEYWPKLKAVLEQDHLSSRPLFSESTP